MTQRLMTALALTAILGTSPASAGEFRTEYTVSAIGLKIATTRFETTLTDDSYAINGTLRSAGVARLFTTTDGSLSATGSVSKGGIAARSFEVQYTDNKKSKRTTIASDGGRVTDYSNAPKINKGKDWVDVASDHLVGALDPIAASMVPAASLRDVCNKTVRLFDGAMRADLKLSYLRTTPFSAKGFSGDAVTCEAKFVPVSGYRKNKREIKWMRDNGRIEISFAAVGSTGFYAPVRAKVRAEAATIHLTATRFEQIAQ